ncbi:MAG: hypothetical protein COB46_05475, partial [Rhodospirillaceae bacterium]
MAEALGVGMVMPFVLALTDPNAIQKYEALGKVAEMFNVETQESFISVLGLAVVILFVTKNLMVLALLRWQVFFVGRSEADLAIRLLKKYHNMSLLDVMQRNSSELIRNINDEVSAFFNGFVLATLQMFTELVVILGIAVIVFTADPYAAIGMALFFLVMAGGYYYF